MTTIVSHPSAPIPAVRSRWEGLDWLRAGATVLVVCLHAGIPYLKHPMPGLAWPARESASIPVDVLCWGIDAFIMPLFFLQSGFFAAQLMRRHGPDGFLKHRVQRVGGPLLFGMVVILPLDLYAWLLSWVGQGLITARKLRSLKIDSPLGENLWGLSHLWFLEYLLVFCVIAWGLQRLAALRKRDTLPMHTPSHMDGSSWLAMLGAIAISGLALWWQPRVVIGFRHSWWPLAANMLYYAPCFGLGWMWSRSRRGSRQSQLSFGIRLAVGALMFAGLYPLLQQHLAAESIPVANPLLPFMFAASAWMLSTGFFGWCLYHVHVSPPKPVQYLAEASFWIYLMHHPVVGLVQGNLVHWNISSELKFAIATSAGLGMSLLTYHAFVRRSWIGELLNGRRIGAPVSPAADPSRQSVAA
ncbi:MAG: acyltransferase family protein [Planctomycetaceae bacterium]|nr:acyltransferase family protein [Planctomycetaceae bacterium]